MRVRIKDISGSVYGNWTVIKLSEERGPASTAKWHCVCSCGSRKIVLGTSLRNGTSKSCGCIPTGVQPSGEMPYKKIYKSLKEGARTRGKTFEISYEYFKSVSSEPCHLCGQQPYDKHYAYSRLRYSKDLSQDPYAVFNSIDRIDSALGYTVENVKPCCRMCNRLKSDFSIEELYRQISLILSTKENRNEQKVSNHPTN